MSHMSYYKRANINGRRYFHGRSSSNSSSSSSSRGFRLKYSKRFSVQGLRARFVYLFRLLSRWRFSYGQALKSLKKGIINRNSNKNNYNYSIKRNNSCSRRGLVTMEMQQNMNSNVSRSAESGMRSFSRSNSFYAEAIADCLEFIKRSSISVDQNPVCQR